MYISYVCLCTYEGIQKVSSIQCANGQTVAYSQSRALSAFASGRSLCRFRYAPQATCAVLPQRASWVVLEFRVATPPQFSQTSGKPRKRSVGTEKLAGLFECWVATAAYGCVCVCFCSQRLLHRLYCRPIPSFGESIRQPRDFLAALNKEELET